MGGPGSVLTAAFSLFVPLLFIIFQTCNADINSHQHKGHPKKQHPRSKTPPHQITGPVTQNRVVVAQDGSGNYTKIQDAVTAATRRPVNGRFEIYVKRGRYKEQVKVEGPNAKDITIVGDGIGNTIITGDKHFQKGLSTSDTATFSVKAPGFIAKFITFENTAGPGGNQAVALKSESDQAVYYKCRFEGYQDTVYLFPGRQFFRECDISGSMDMICGNSIAVFQRCNIFLKKHNHNEVTITSSKRERDDNTGFVIQNSRVTLTDELKRFPGVKVFLGRPWGRYSRTVYMRTYLEAIYPQGWTYMDQIRDGNFVDYAEFENVGPGANSAGRIKWRGVRNIDKNVASKFTVRNFLQGGSWIASAGVPYDLDL
ncbi:hypothetical protein RD792_008940 [Penstemon davidsonii]|uniref:Pectinesterase catalytic domain-containing protein n=1 Tax=Penstemon davidsonii TaxID=160366 RepID=A0ABR0DAK6_9LAMI|nr:hypothetical protein RD792_008940 [Penstemon davidsonii]